MEKKVADTMLEIPEEVIIGGESYKMPPPSIATLVLFSKYVGQMPKETLDEEFPIASLLQQADKLHLLGYALSAVILGAKEFHKEVDDTTKKGFFNRKSEAKPTITKGEELSQKINQIGIDEVTQVFVKLLKFLRIQDFFQLTTSLIELNLTKRTKMEEVGTKTTASGQ